MRLLNHIESENYMFSPQKGHAKSRINPLLQQSRGQGSQYAQVLYIMKNCMSSKKDGAEEDEDAIMEFEGDYLA